MVFVTLHVQVKQGAKFWKKSENSVLPRPCLYTGQHCETVSECSVPCKHGRCTNKPDVCECESHWGPPGHCSIYQGPCLNCSSVGGTCEKGPNTCDCKPGLLFLKNFKASTQTQFNEVLKSLMQQQWLRLQKRHLKNKYFHNTDPPRANLMHMSRTKINSFL